MSGLPPAITAATCQANVLTVASAPAMSMAQLYQSLAMSQAMMAMNAVYAQQQTNMLFQSATAQSVRVLLGRS